MRLHEDGRESTLGKQNARVRINSRVDSHRKLFFILSLGNKTHVHPNFVSLKGIKQKLSWMPGSVWASLLCTWHLVDAAPRTVPPASHPNEA